MNSNDFLQNENAQRKMEQFHINKSSTWQGDVVSRFIFDMSKKYLSKDILDVGAGTGALVNLINKNSKYSAAGVDLHPKKSFIKKGVITDLPFSDSMFGTVFCTEVLEHLTLSQIDKGLSEIKRVLSADGYFIITVPFNEDLNLGSYNCPDCDKVFHPFGHLQSFNLKNISSLLKKGGFKIISKRILPLHLMAKLPYSIFYYNLLSMLIKKMDYTKTLFIIAQKR